MTQQQAGQSSMPHHWPLTLEITLPVTQEDMCDAEGSAMQAAQNVIGHTGAVVLDLIDDTGAEEWFR